MGAVMKCSNPLGCSVEEGRQWPKCLGPVGICERVLPIKAAGAMQPERVLATAVANDPILSRRVMPWEAPLTAIVHAAGGLPKPKPKPRPSTFAA